MTDPSGRDGDEPPGTAAPGAWTALPRPLRVGTLWAACLVVLAVGVYLAVLLLNRIAPLTFAVGMALLLTALTEPVSAGLRRLRLPSWLAALLLVIALIGVVALPVILLVSQTQAEFHDLGGKVGDGIGEVRDWLVNGPLSLDAGQVDAVRQALLDRVRGAVPDLLSGASTAVEALATVLIALFLIFFLIKDGRSMWRWVLDQTPHRQRARLAEAGRTGWDTLGRFTRGMFIVATVDAVGIGIALLIIDVPLVVPLALLTFIGGFIPYLGAALSGSAAVLVALVTNGPTDALLVLVSVLAVQSLEGNILEPLIVGRAVRLHPAVILLAVSAGALIGGVFGALVATPVLAIAYQVWTRLRTPATAPTPSGTVDPGPGNQPRAGDGAADRAVGPPRLREG
jgi:predicted PurR-regulated permease PerM